MNKRFSKFLTLLALLLGLTLVIAACGGSQEEAESGSAEKITR